LAEKRGVVEVPLIPKEDVDRVLRRPSKEPECQGGKDYRHQRLPPPLRAEVSWQFI
jgi:hypothetical protein